MNERFLVRIDFQNDFAAPEGALTINNPDLIARHQRFADSLQKECSAKSGIFAIRIWQKHIRRPKRPRAFLCIPNSVPGVGSRRQF